jgi:hypothetical protein
MIEMMFFSLCFGAMFVYLLSIIYVVFQAKANKIVEDEEYINDFVLEQLQEVHQNNTYNVKDIYIHKGQQITPEMFK